MASSLAIRKAMRLVIDERGREWLMPTPESIKLAEDPAKRAERLAKLRAFLDTRKENA